MFSNVGKTEDNQLQTLKNSGTEPTDSRLDGRSREAEHFTRGYLLRLNGWFTPKSGSGIGGKCAASYYC
ncbi:MAG: hypothetical protein ACRC2T_08540 [Thermoguttaceae bacterium]